MSCAACQARVEKAVSKVPGVTSCSVSLLTNSMGVEGTAAASDIIQAVENAGYGASVKGTGKSEKESGQGGGISAVIAAQEEALEDRTTPLLKKRLAASIGFLLVLMYFSMGVHMWGWPMPAFMQDNHVAMGLLQLLLAGIVMVINQKFFTSGFRSLFHGAPNMDSLIALGSGAAFVYSTIMLFVMTRAQVDGGSKAAMPYMNEFYFESAAMILALITVGKMLESYSKGKTTNALKSLMKLAPETVTLLRGCDEQGRGGEEVTVPVDTVRKGDYFVVRPGESIPVDAVVVEGTSAVNESALTGESIPVDKVPGDMVSSATLNQSGFLKCRAERVGEDTSLSRIIQMVSDAAATKAPVAKLADTISGYFVPAVILISVITVIIWLLAGRDTGFALARGICVLVVSCPCALGLATPVAIMVGNGVGAKNGILFKTAVSLQEAGTMQIMALDKTGTITNGEPRVTDILYCQDGTLTAADMKVSAQEMPDSQRELLVDAISLEKKSEHPLAKAVIAYTDLTGIEAEEADSFKALPGNGLRAVRNGHVIAAGNERFISEYTKISQDAASRSRQLADEGKTPLFFVRDDQLLGIIAVADTMKEDSAEAVRQLKNMGIHVVMLTGDNRRTAEAIGKQAGVNEVVAGVLPDQKQEIIAKLQTYGKVAMVGDGINDAPALTKADIGIAIGAGTDVAIDAADIVLMKSRLTDVAAAVRLSRATYRNILENLFWALIYNTLLIPLAAGAYVHAFGITMNPMFGAAAMSLSSFCVVSNALRLNLFQLYHPAGDKRRKNAVSSGSDKKLLTTDTVDARKTVHDKVTGQQSKEEKKMKKTMVIEGMMCEHCEATVKKALEKIDGVDSAQVSHTEGTAVVTLHSEVDDAVLKQAVEDKDYVVKEIA